MSWWGTRHERLRSPRGPLFCFRDSEVGQLMQHSSLFSRSRCFGRLRTAVARRESSSSIEAWYVALFAANLVMGMSSILLPLKLDRVLHLGPRELGVLSTTASLGAVIGSLLWGRLSDAAHRRKGFVVASYFAVGILHAGFALSASFRSLLICNALLSFFWIANASVAVLLVIERTSERSWESHISALNLSGAVGWLLGLVLGGFGIGVVLEAFSMTGGIEILFAILSLFGFASAALAAWLIPSTRARYTERRFRGLIVAAGNLLVEASRFNALHLYHRMIPRRLGSLRRETRLFLLSSALAFTGIGFFGAPLAMLLSQHLGYSPSVVFYSYVMLHSGIVLAYPLALRRIKSRGNRRAQIAALSVRFVLFGLIGVFLALGARPTWGVAVPFLFLIGVSWAYFQLSGVALASRFAKPENRGLALGTYNAVAGGSTMIAGVSSGYLAQGAGYSMTYIVASVLLLASILVLAKLPDPAALQAKIDPAAGEDV